jgi:hypothetical protein
VSPADDGAGDPSHLVRGFALTKHDLREALPDRAVVIDPGKSEVLCLLRVEHRAGAQVRLGRVEVTGADGLEQGSK